jgi:predicted nuclease with TOPRIM domain
MDQSWEELRLKNETAIEELKRAQWEIEEIQRELGEGTLDRRRLESGLKKLHHEVCEIAAHIPHFKK